MKEKGIDAEYYQGLSLGCGIILETLINVIFKGMSHCALSYFRAFTLGVCVPCSPPPHLCLRECWAFLRAEMIPGASPVHLSMGSLPFIGQSVQKGHLPFLTPFFKVFPQTLSNRMSQTAVSLRFTLTFPWVDSSSPGCRHVAHTPSLARAES